MFTISRRDVEDAYGYADRALKRARDYEGSSKPLHTLVETTEVMFGGFVMGAAAGAFGSTDGQLNVPGTKAPMDLTVGIALKLAQFTGWLGGAGDHVGNLANGALAFYAGRFGVGFGNSHRQAPTPATSGTDDKTGAFAEDIVGGSRANMGAAPPQARTEPLTEAELVALGSPSR